MSVWYDDYMKKEEALFTKRENEAALTVKKLADAIQTFKKDYGRFPDSLDMLIERPNELNRSGIGRWPYFDGNKIPLDPWGQYYRYRVPGKYNPESFDVWSVHGHSRNADLWIGNWKKSEKADK